MRRQTRPGWAVFGDLAEFAKLQIKFDDRNQFFINLPSSYCIVIYIRGPGYTRQYAVRVVESKTRQSLFGNRPGARAILRSVPDRPTVPLSKRDVFKLALWPEGPDMAHMGSTWTDPANQVFQSNQIKRKFLDDWFLQLCCRHISQKTSRKNAHASAMSVAMTAEI